MKDFPIDPPLPAGAKRVLVAGGTFDPPHRAHLHLALAAAKESGCDHVLFVPAGQSPLKDAPGTPAAHRLAMLRLALEGEKRASISTFEIDRGGPSYTVETLRALRAALPEAVELRLFMGSDQLRWFDQWREAAQVAELARPVVVLRPPDTLESLRAAGVGESRLAWVVSTPADEASSTQARERIARGEGASGLVAPRVLEYIRAHGLYGSGAS